MVAYICGEEGLFGTDSRWLDYVCLFNLERVVYLGRVRASADIYETKCIYGFDHQDWSFVFLHLPHLHVHGRLRPRPF